MRAVAARLEAVPMALYNHFATKEQLVAALLDRVLGRFEPPPASADWIEDLRAFARAHRQLLARHAWAVGPIFANPSPGLSSVRIGELALQILERGGLSKAKAVAAFSGVIAINYGWASFGVARDTEVEAMLRALPADVFPLTVATAAGGAPMAATPTTSSCSTPSCAGWRLDLGTTRLVSGQARGGGAASSLGGSDQPRRSKPRAGHGDGRPRQDTELLSNTLIEVLEEQAGRVFASRLQWLFRTAAAVRGGDEAAAERLVAYLGGVPDESVEPIIRACSVELQLANIAEERERVRRRRQYDATGAVQRESLAETAEILRRNDIDIAPLTAQLQIEHVLTAHPTEATRRSVLDHQWDVAALLDRLDDPRTGHARRRALLAELREVLTLWWQTDELRRIRPRVEDEVRRNLFFFEAVLFDAVPLVLGEIEHALDVRLVQPVLSYGSWTGGDMDGHPEVGADTLARALQLHRNTALRMFRDRVDQLARAFSHSSLRVPLSEELTESLEHDAAELPSATVLRRPHREWEPLRTKLGFVHHRLPTRCSRAGASPATPTRRRCGATSSSCSRTSTRATWRWARSSGCCGRSTCSASTWPGSTSARARTSCARPRRRSSRATPTPTSRAARRC